MVTVSITAGPVEHRVLGQCSRTRVSGSEISDTATLFRCGREKTKRRQLCSRGHLPCWLTWSVSISPTGPSFVKLYSLHLVTHPRGKRPSPSSHPSPFLPPGFIPAALSSSTQFLNVSTTTREFFVVGTVRCIGGCPVASDLHPLDFRSTPPAVLNKNAFAITRCPWGGARSPPGGNTGLHATEGTQERTETLACLSRDKSKLALPATEEQ